MKVISYSLFGDPKSFEFNWYLRGILFNIRMNRLLYPDWSTWVFVQGNLHNTHNELLMDLQRRMNGMLVFQMSMDEPDRCRGMIWRLMPLFANGVTHVICRDADAITTYREAQAVQEWVDSGLGFHGITDDPAHSIPMMGGMCGFRTDHFKATFPEYDTFEKLIEGFDLKNHGTDQNLLMQRIYPKAKDNMMGHFFKGCTDPVKITRNSVSTQIPGVSPKLWESNLTCRMIGSPGVVDFELLRFFKRFDPNPAFDEFEKKFPDVFYWHR